MSPELLGIQPHELKFTFELKKQSFCSVQLLNNSDQYVAFKVKTTSPKRYSVRPNTGIIQPNSSCNFTVIMQAQREAPPNLQCKDKFLIQSTVVPVGTTTEDITPNTFSKDSGGKYIEENKLRVVLVDPPHSPVLLPMNGVLKQESSGASLISGDQENLPPPQVVAKDVKVLPLANDPEKLKLPKDSEDLKLANEVKELKSKLNQLESKLNEDEITIRALKDAKNTTIKERQTLQEELAILRRSNGVRKVQVGFPFLFVCMVAFVSMTLGYLLRR